MPHIQLKEGLPGILGPMAFRPETSKPLNLLADTLLRSANGFSAGDRELIATYVSYLNDCFFCQTTHGAVASAHFKGDENLIKQVKQDYTKAPISEKLKSLLHIASLVQKSGKSVTEQAVMTAKATGASDIEIHDTVLIAAAFCMFNRYVDGLATWAHQDHDAYRQMGVHLANTGYASADQDLVNR